MTPPNDATPSPGKACPVDPVVDILLATYNGAAYLEEQLASIEAQTHTNWHLIARDDGSADRTPSILEAFRSRYPGKVTILRDNEGNLGLVRNFSRLMETSNAPYAAFCDQDDVWLPEKLSLSLHQMRELEAVHGPGTPLLVFTDLTVVDRDLTVIHPSFWHYEGIRPERCRALSRLLAQNVVTGCTAFMNRTLVSKSLPIPAEAKVHDWWIALIASGLGVASYLKQPTVLYRQHEGNVIGAKKFSVLKLLTGPYWIVKNYAARRQAIETTFRQADAAARHFGNALGYADRLVLDHFIRLPGKTVLGRLMEMRKYKILPCGLLVATLFIVFSFE